MLALGLAWLVSGCDSLRGPHQGIVAPAVEGRVLDAVTLEPVTGARVHRVAAGTSTPSAAERHGGEVLQDPLLASTGPDGSFRLGEIRGGYLLFERAPPLLVTLRIEHSRYRMFSTNVDLLKVQPVQMPAGPAIPVGDLRLTPKNP